MSKTNTAQAELNLIKVSGFKRFAANGKVTQQINVTLFLCDEANGYQITLEAGNIDKLFARHDATPFCVKVRYPRLCGEQRLRWQAASRQASASQV